VGLHGVLVFRVSSAEYFVISVSFSTASIDDVRAIPYLLVIDLEGRPCR